MARRKKHRKVRRSKARHRRRHNSWSPAKLRAYKKAKRNLIHRFNRSASGSVTLS